MTDNAWSLPSGKRHPPPEKDCEEVPGEDATYYCEGVYYRAYYQGNRVVYGPEALEE